MFCSRCGEPGDVIGCDGTCLRSFHRTCLAEHEQPKANAPADSRWWVASYMSLLPNFCAKSAVETLC